MSRVLFSAFAVGLVLTAFAHAAGTGAQSGERSAFDREENALLYQVSGASLVEERIQSRLALGRFYMGRELYVEALAALAADEGGPGADEASLMVARAQYGLGRYATVLRTLDDERLRMTPEGAALRAMSLTELGAFKAAAGEFELAKPPASATPEFLLDFHVLASAAALETGDSDRARAGMAAAQALRIESASAELALASAEIMLKSGERGAREAMRTLMKSPDSRLSALAELHLVAEDARTGAASRRRASAELAALRHKWSGGAFDRELQTAAAAFIPEDEIIDRMNALRLLAHNHPRSDAAAQAKQDLAAALRTLLADRNRNAREVARAVYDGLAYLPRGSEGDAMVRGLVTRLVRLDLLSEAAELLEHQVFKRLRGAERSTVAADLAQIYLDDRRPSEALRVLRSTRVAGIDAQVLDRRRFLEATALERTGAPDAALELLQSASSASIELRAEIEWRSHRWADAAATYAAILGEATAPLNERQRNALLRAGAAYVLAGDEASFADLRAESVKRFGGFPEQELLGFMSLDGSEAGAGFMEAYRRLYAAEG